MMPGIPDGAITTADLYRKLESIADTVIRMEERVRVLPDFEARLRMLERFRFTLLGAAAGVGTLSGIVSALLTHAR